jgi:hypothetical protein
LAARFGGVSGGKETQGWRVSCNGRWRNVGSPKLPHGDLPGKAFVLPEDGRAACRTGVKVSALPLSAVRVHNWLAFKRMELANLTVVNPHVGVPVAVFRFPPLAGLTWPGI